MYIICVYVYMYTHAHIYMYTHIHTHYLSVIKEKNLGRIIFFLLSPHKGNLWYVHKEVEYGILRLIEFDLDPP